MTKHCAYLALMSMASAAALSAQEAPVKVTTDNFVRAETDGYMAKAVKDGAFGKLVHVRAAPSIEKQAVVRMNRDTLYSQGVFDMEAGDVTVHLPDTGKRFMSLQVLSEDQYTIQVDYAPGTYRLTRSQVGTRYMYLIVRTLADPGSETDMKAAHAAQDAIKVEQAGKGSFVIPAWDTASRDKVRSALKTLAASGGGMEKAFGKKNEVDPVQYLIGAATGWGGNPIYAAKYIPVYPEANDGKTVYSLTVRDVPVDGFWSISVYNAEGFFEKNSLGVYSINNLTARPNADKSVTIQFGGCTNEVTNCIPTSKGWNYIVRLYRARKPLLDGSWTFPEARPHPEQGQ